MDGTEDILDLPWYDLEPLNVADVERIEQNSRFLNIDVNQFISEQENKETARKTKSHLKVLSDFLQINGESRDIYKIPPSTLNTLLSNFVVCVRKQNGENDEPNTLRGFVSSFERYLKQHDYGVSIITSSEFGKTREALKAKQIQLKKEGRGNKPEKSDPITDTEIQKLYDHGRCSPDTLLNTLWLNNSVHFGLRGVKEHRQMKWGDVTINTDSSGNEYLEYSTERQTKTRTGINPRDTRKINPRVYATQSDRCPVSLYKFYAEKRTDVLNSSDSPFYIASKSKKPTGSDIWYKNQCVGENKLAGIMKTMKAAAGLSGQKKLTNASARKDLTHKLLDNNVPPTDVMQITGHKNVQSILNYSSLSEERQQEISRIIDTPAHSSAFKIPPNVSQNQYPPVPFPSQSATSFSSEESFSASSGVDSLLADVP